VVKEQLPGEPLITQMKQMAQMKKNNISVEPKVRNLWFKSALIRGLYSETLI
jgi:hypothetical protein